MKTLKVNSHAQLVHVYVSYHAIERICCSHPLTQGLRLCVVVKQDLALAAQCYWDCRESSSISYENMVKLLF